jgi:ApaG protein
MITYAQTTRDITVRVQPIYLDAPSNPVLKEFAFGYAVCIENEGDQEVQLLRRQWTIREKNGSRENLNGDTHLQSQPILEPGETHVYDGSCTLTSFAGSVEGNFLVRRPSGERFRVDIPPFHLNAAAN